MPSNFILVYPTQEYKGGPMHLNPVGFANKVKPYAIVSRYLCGIVQHTQTPMVARCVEVEDE